MSMVSSKENLLFSIKVPPAFAASITLETQVGTLIWFMLLLVDDCILSCGAVCWHEKHIAWVWLRMVS